MSRISLVIALAFPFAASAAPDIATGSSQAQAQRAVNDILLSMGPDPGGHSGDGVNPTTTKTDHPAVDGPSQPDGASASNESNEAKKGSGNSDSEPARQKNETAGPSSSGQTGTNR